MHSPIPLTRDIVLVGGGHTHALVLRRWGMKPLAGARLTVINPAPTAPYTGMLPGHIAGHYDRDALEIDLVRLARFAGARLVLGYATGIDRETRRIHVTDHTDIRYDVACLDVGITSEMPKIPGFNDYAVAAKPLGPFATRWATFCDAVAVGEKAPDVAVIGAGVAGVELALAMHHRLTSLGAEPRVTIIEAANALDAVSGNTRAVLFERLWRAGIHVVEHDPVTRITAQGALTHGGKHIPAALTIGAAGARPHPWMAELGLAHANGFVTVDPYLRSVTDPSIYAVGDCADLAFAPRPKAGVYAVRAAPILAQNLRADVSHGTRRAFRPQKDYLKLISLGGKEAAADRSGFTLAGAALWRWKDHIDQTFMTKLSRLPAMPKAPLPAHRTRGVAEATGSNPPCAGCGGKVGPGGLSAALSRLPAPRRADIASLPGDDAAILRTRGATQVMTTDHLRAFTEDPATFARITTLHALGDIWAMGAAPQAATATVILPHMIPEMAEATLAELLEPAAEILRSEGAELVGGHTTYGAELTFGLTITGLCTAPPITLTGAQPGDALILTRPIGSGTLLAAEMRLQARGKDIADLLAILLQSQSEAAKALAQAGARAMTDVTGFGLAGHLMNLCDASGVAARVYPNSIPLFQGAEDLARRGVRSSLWPENYSAVAPRMTGDIEAWPLLCDPQTAGGFLAAVPHAKAKAVLEDITAKGHRAALIGEILDAPPHIELSAP